jgi:eukaryotic-like serine/threonine-protein kinase
MKDRWQKIKELYEAALMRPPNERPSFLNERCDGDEELRREVESLLSFSSSAESFLESPAVGEVADIIIPESEKLEVGKAFGHYEVIRQIGAGGMGEVYLARDKKLDRQVAVKILNEKFAEHESNLQRFIREAKSASALNHPNILTVHEVGESDKAHYIVSEFIKGKTLREKLKESRLPLSEVLEITIQIANALAAAHEANLVHRDIKPENVMIRPDGFVKVLDFGLAKLIEQKNKTFLGLENSTKQQNETAKGVILGTINYMSPEQARGLDIDARTDVWSLGVCLYEMLAGRTPFAGETTNDTIAAILTGEPAPLDENTPQELQRIVRKSLQKKRDERYQTIRDFLLDVKNLKRDLEFAEVLERSAVPKDAKSSNGGANESDENATAILPAAAVSTQNSLSPPTSSAEYIVRKISGSKRAAVFGSVILLTLVGLGYWYFFNRPSSIKQIESIAVMPFVNASPSADVEYLSDGMTETLIKSLSNLPNLSVKPRSSVFRYKGKDTDLQTIAKELNVQAVLNGRVVQRGDALTLSLELVDVQKDSVIWSESYNRKPSDLVALQSEIARDVLTNLKTKLSGADEQKVAKSGTTDPEAYQLYLKGRHQWNKSTGESLKQAVEYYRQAIEKDPNFALAYSGLAETYVQFGGYNVAPAEDSMPLAKAAALRALEIDDSVAEAHAALGDYLMLYEFDLERSEKAYRRAIELKPDYAIAHQGYSQNLTVVKRFDEALAEIRLAEQLDPLSPDIGTDVGAVLVFARRYDEAIAQLKRTLVRDPNFSRAHSYLGWAYGSKGMYREAIAAARKALELSDSYFIKAYLAFWLGKSGNRDEALKILAELEKAASEGYVRPSAMAVVYIGLGDKEEALNQLEKEVSSRSFNAIYLAVLPDVDDLRSEPRFKAMLKRINLPE